MAKIEYLIMISIQKNAKQTSDEKYKENINL